MKIGAIPAWYARLVSSFPLISMEKAVDRHSTIVSSNHILYVAEGHPRPKGSLKGSERCKGTSSRMSWASCDPYCLSWQMAMLFAGVLVRSEQVDNQSIFDEDYPGESFADVPVLLDCSGNRVLEKDFVSWVKARRARREPKSNAGAAFDEQAVRCMIEGPLEAGVLLEVSLRPRTDEYVKRAQPFFSYHFENALRFDHAKTRATRLAAKRHVTPTALSPSWSTTMHGVLRGGLGTALGSVFEGGTDLETEKRMCHHLPSRSSVDEDEIRQAASEALEAIAALAFPTGEESWIGDHDGPTLLDAKLFAYLHTILSLPVTSMGAPASQSATLLRDTLLKNKTLSAYTRRIWREFVLPLGG